MKSSRLEQAGMDGLEQRKDYNPGLIGLLEKEENRVDRYREIEVLEQPPFGEETICISSWEEFQDLPDSYKELFRPYAMARFGPEGNVQDTKRRIWLVLRFKNLAERLISERRKVFPSDAMPEELIQEVLEMSDGEEIYLRFEDLMASGIEKLIQSGNIKIGLITGKIDLYPGTIEIMEDIWVVRRKIALCARNAIKWQRAGLKVRKII